MWSCKKTPVFGSFSISWLIASFRPTATGSDGSRFRQVKRLPRKKALKGVMGSYQSPKEEIKRSADVVELIGQYVKLRKAGRNYVGLCPFHAEKDPSFTVNPQRQTFHCFGCKKGGDIFDFWMEYHSTSFPEALRDLAERYHIPLSEGYSAEAEKKRMEERDAVFRINEIAAGYFQQTLRHPSAGKPARDYLKKRRIPDETISMCRLGFAADKWDGLIRVLADQHIDMETAVRAGVVVKKEGGGYYDRFRGRLIFPIIDQRQQVIGFGGRVLDDSLPKYLNSPESPVFHKAETLYGLHASFNAIREKGRAVLVEGYMDWISLRKHGLKEAVATLGTALTDRHVRKLKGYAKEAIVVFDSDESGKSAMLRSLYVFSNEGLAARAVVLPDGHDPDSLVNERGLDTFEKLLDQGVPIFDFFLEQKLTEAKSDEGKVRALREILPALSEIRDFALRSLYVRRLSERSGIREEVILAELKTGDKQRAPKGQLIPEKENSGGTAQKKPPIGDLQVLSLLLYYPDTIPRLMKCDCRILVSDPQISELVDLIFEKYLQQGGFSPETLLDDMVNDGAKERLMETLHRPSVVFSEQDAIQCVTELEEKAHKKKIAASFRKVKGDLVAQNELLKLKRQGPPGPEQARD
ncbi:MAG: DNA primase [Desulfococcus sp. 4484_242]|nr:MAG: DNA primase [Desulfococcus sp. 4484_242]